jgi:hypothetical protein
MNVTNLYPSIYVAPYTTGRTRSAARTFQKIKLLCIVNKWRIKLNESKSVHIDFTNKKITQQPIFINGTQVPYANTAEYLGMTLDAKLRCKEHIKKKNVISSTSSSEKCTGCLDANPSCQSTINSYYRSKLYVQFGIMVSSFRAAPVSLILKWFNAIKTKC